MKNGISMERRDIWIDATGGESGGGYGHGESMLMIKEQIQTWQILSGKGFSLIPVTGKRPLEQGWQQWCERRRSFNPDDFKGHNAAVATGPASGILVLDLDDIRIFAVEATKQGRDLPATYQVETGSGNLHYYYSYPNNGKPYTNRSFKKEGFDIRGLGGCVVAPGSIHPDTGKPYKVYADLPIVEAPKWLKDLSRGEAIPMPQVKIEQGPHNAPDLNSLPISGKLKDFLKTGAPGEYPSRSEALFASICALAGVSITDGEIFAIMESCPGGEKFREKGNARERWLCKEILRARQFISTNITGHEEASSIEFPDIMGGVAGEFAKVYSTYLESPEHFFFACFLTCLGSFIPVTLASELLTQPRLFVLLLGQSADDRKSTAISKTASFFRDALTDFGICYGVGSAEGLQKKLKELQRLLLCLDEMKQFVSKCKVEGAVLLPLVNTLFEQNHYEAQTKKVSIELRDVHLSLLAASTIQTYERTWDASFTDIGFNNRLFIVPGSGHRRFSFPEQIPEKEKYLLRKRLGEILSFVGSGLSIGITQEGRELYHNWYLNHDRSVHAKRLDTYAIRFMMLLAVNDLKSEIDQSTVERVIKLMDWQLAVRQLHDPIDADGKMAVMEEKIRRVLRTGPFSDRDLQRRTHAARSGSWVYQTAMRNLQAGKQIWFDKATRCWRLS